MLNGVRAGRWFDVLSTFHVIDAGLDPQGFKSQMFIAEKGKKRVG